VLAKEELATSSKGGSRKEGKPEANPQKEACMEVAVASRDDFTP
jgi:hypothetical protein